MKTTVLIVLAFLCSSMAYNTAATESVKLFLNGKEVKEQLSIKATGKLEIVLPEGWRYISGKIKIVNGGETKIAKQITGETALKEFDVLSFVKTNAVVGNHLSLELSVRTKESGTLATMKIPVVE